MNIFKGRDWGAFGIFIAMVILNIVFVRAIQAGHPLPASSDTPVVIATPAAGCPAPVALKAVSDPL